jgi:hypothetical protein
LDVFIDDMSTPHNAKNSQSGGTKLTDEKSAHGRAAEKHVAEPASPTAIREYLGITRESQSRVTQLLTQSGVFHGK